MSIPVFSSQYADQSAYNNNIPLQNPIFQIEKEESSEISISLPEDSRRDINDLDQKIASYRKKLSKAWYWDLRGYQIKAMKNLNDNLFFLSMCAINGKQPTAEMFVPCIKAIACLKETYDEMSKRENTLPNRLFRRIFSSNIVVKGSTYLGAGGLALAGIVFGGSFLFEGETFHALTICGIIIGVTGLTCAMTSIFLERYYKFIRVNKSDIRIQEAFNEFLQCYINNDYESCEDLLNKLPLQDQMGINNRIGLLELVKNADLSLLGINSNPPIMMKSLQTSFENIQALPRINEINFDSNVENNYLENSYLNSNHPEQTPNSQREPALTFNDLSKYINEKVPTLSVSKDQIKRGGSKVKKDS